MVLLSPSIINNACSKAIEVAVKVLGIS